MSNQPDRKRYLLTYTPEAKTFARQQRGQSTMNERRLWQLLRANRLGVHFRRQAPVIGYCIDFLAAEVMLAVELDGPTHETATGKARDMVRDRRLAARGLKVLRIRDEEMNRDPDAVIARIRKEIEKRQGRARTP